MRGDDALVDLDDFGRLNLRRGDAAGDSVLAKVGELLAGHTGGLVCRVAADQFDALLIGQTGEGLWHRATPLGPNGYFGDVSFDGTIVSHHILTIDGIRGRDTLGGQP